MTNYINPFEKRKFSARFRAVFAFAKQNFVSVIKYDLLVFVAIAALFALLLSANPESKINNLGSLINFVCFSYFTHYILNKGDMHATSFKDMLKSTGNAFGKIFVASILPFIGMMLCLASLGILGFIFVLISGKNIALIVTLSLFLLFVIYIVPILNIYYAHSYFSSKYKSSIDVFQESYRMVKGHWWNTFGFCLLLGLIGEVSVLLISVLVLWVLPNDSSFIGLWVTFTICFIVLFFTTHTATVFQYGHLKALKDEEQENLEEGDSVTQEEIQE